MKIFFKEQWEKYRKRKTKAGIVLDFMFLILFILILNPSTRLPITSFFIKYTMMSPKESSDKMVLKETDYNWKYLNLNHETKDFSDLKGKVVFLNFWATWCPPCVAEFSSIDDLYKEFGNQVEFVLVSNEDSGTLKRFLTKKGYEVPVSIMSQRVPSSLFGNTYPTTLIISKKGEVVVNKVGAAKWNSDQFKDLLKKLIAE